MDKTCRIIGTCFIAAILLVSYSITSTANDDLEIGRTTCEYEPKNHNFYNMLPGETASTTFEIWKSGSCCQVSYKIIEDCPWLDISPTSGTSNGERDLINVFIDTTGLQLGLHSYNIFIQSNADVDPNHEFNVKVNIVDINKPVLAFSPDSYDFGKKPQNETIFKNLNIWNDGLGNLEYNLAESCDWVTLSTNSGESIGEYDQIKVTISTESLDFGRHTCDITISSNGGTGIFTVNVTVGDKFADLNVDIKGGVGLRAIVKNTGDINAKNIKVDIEIEGGFLFSKNRTTKTYTEIEAGSSKEIKLRVFGFGMGIFKDKPKLKIIIEAEGLFPTEKNLEMKYLFFFVII